MSLQTYIQYTFEIPENIDKEIIISILSDFDFEGFVETDKGFLAYTPQNADNENAWYDTIKNISQNILFSKEILEPKNWNEEWEKNYDIVKINEYCEIYAPFHKVNPAIQYPIFIEPKMSFGTGHHPTTFMMINLLFDIKEHIKNKTVIDVGCGTGILGIIAKKLNAQKVICIDIDEICIENTKENAVKNNVSVSVLQATIQEFIKKYPHEKFDIITANIHKNIILNDLPYYKSILNPQGYLLISGILKEDEQIIINAAQPLKHIQTNYQNEWISILLKN